MHHPWRAGEWSLLVRGRQVFLPATLLRLSLATVVVGLFLSALALPATAQLDTLSHGGILRDYLVHLPPSYDGENRLPLVLAFHGGFGSANNLENQSGLSDVADEEDFIVVYPNGTGQIPTWNGGECCGYAARENIDDVGFVEKLLERLDQDFSVDLERVYATGISNGGAMTYRLVCELAHRIVAAGPVAVTHRDETCSPNPPVPIIHFHSRRDENIPIAGGVGNGPSVVDWLPLDSTLTNFAGYNGCTTRSDEQISDSLLVTTWSDCSPTGLPVKLYLTEDGGHSWPGGTRTIIGDSVSTAVDASREMWNFFEQFVGRPIVESTSELTGRKPEILISIFPDPAPDIVRARVETLSATEANLSIFDIAGRRVYSRSGLFLAPGVHTLDLELRGLPAGVYFGRFRTQSDIVRFQFVVM